MFSNFNSFDLFLHAHILFYRFIHSALGGRGRGGARCTQVLCVTTNDEISSYFSSPVNDKCHPSRVPCCKGITLV